MSGIWVTVKCGESEDDGLGWESSIRCRLRDRVMW